MNYFIKQIGSKDCGYTCVKMLLAIVYKNKDFLYYPVPSIEISTTLKDLMRFANKEGVTLSGYRQTRKDILQLKNKCPLLIPINVNEYMHMVLVKKIKKKKVLIYDPNKGVVWININKLKNIWQGEYLEVVSVSGSSFKLQKTNPISKRILAFTISFEILSFIALLGTFIVVGNKNTILFPLLLFLSYLLFEFIFRKLLISSVKYFDKDIYSHDTSLNYNDVKNKFINLTKYKSLYISNPVEFLSLSFITFFSSIILGMDNLYHFLVISVFILCHLFLNIYESRRDYISEINSLEDSALNSYNNRNEYISKIELLNKTTYKLLSYDNFKRYFLIFITMILSIVFMKISNNNSINYFLFYFFFYQYLNDNFSKLFNFDKKLEDYKRYKALFLYYLNK